METVLLHLYAGRGTTLTPVNQAPCSPGRLIHRLVSEAEACGAGAESASRVIHKKTYVWWGGEEMGLSERHKMVAHNNQILV